MLVERCQGDRVEIGQNSFDARAFKSGFDTHAGKGEHNVVGLGAVNAAGDLYFGVGCTDNALGLCRGAKAKDGKNRSESGIFAEY